MNGAIYMHKNLEGQRMNTMKSSSHEQREIERYVFAEVEDMLRVSL